MTDTTIRGLVRSAYSDFRTGAFTLWYAVRSMPRILSDPATYDLRARGRELAQLPSFLKLLPASLKRGAKKAVRTVRTLR